MLELGRIPPPRFPDVRLRTPTNWTAVLFLALLGGVHLAIAIPAAFHGRWEGYLSFIFAALFLMSALIARRFATETAVLPSRREIRLRTGTSRWHAERVIPFDAVSAVKLTFEGGCEEEGKIAFVCLTEELECPPTPIPRQQSLFFAMMLGVTLIKVGSDAMQSTSTDRSAISNQKEDERTPS